MSTEMIEWLRAQLDEDESVAKQMRDAVWPRTVHVTVESDDVQVGSVAVSPGFDKHCRRLWHTGSDDHGWVVHESAVEVWSEDVAARVLAEVAAKRRIIDRFEFVDSHGPAVDHVRALDMTTGARAALLDAVKMLASVYAGRPGWREEWAADEEEQAR